MPLPTTLAGWKDLFELLSNATVVLGIPAAIYQYRRGKLREQADREYGTYNALDEKYLDFQNMCFEHPQLDIFDIPDANPQPLTEEQRKQELIAFTMLISVFERAYLMYHDQSNRVKAAQWTGWDEYIRCYCERDNFRNAWEISGETFDRNFEHYVEGIIKRCRANAATPRLSQAGEVVATLKSVESVADANYLSALRLVSQYGWAGGAFNTNELSFLIQGSSSARTTVGFLMLDGKKAIGIAILSHLPSARLTVLHEMVVAQSVVRDALFAQFWSMLLPKIESEFPAAVHLVAEIPQNNPRHLKTEVFARGLAAVGFGPAPWPYSLPTGFNHRTSPSPAQLYVRVASDIANDAYLTIVRELYDSLYRPLWRSISSKPEHFDEELKCVEKGIESETVG